MEHKPRILAAVRPQGVVAVLRALGEYAEVVPVYEYDDAVAALPFVACRIGQRAVPPVMAEAMGIAAQSMGAVAFIDMPLLDADSATDTDFRSQVLRHIR